MKRYAFMIVLTICHGFGCGPSRVSEHQEEIRFLMDTAVRIKVYDAQQSSETVKTIISETFALMAEIEGRTTRYDDSSEVSQVCRNAGLMSTVVSEDVYDIFDAASKVSRETMGAFDVTMDAVQRTWGFFRDHPRVPDPRSITEGLRLVDYQKVGLDRPRVGLEERGMSVDLGGLAKGYVVDRAVDYLQQAGLKAGIVDAGGDLRIFGDHPHRTTWRIGVKHPRTVDGSLFGTIETPAMSIATSGDYERFFMEHGVRYHHILDPRTGLPAKGCTSVTIVTENAMLADAYATAVFVLGPEEGMRFIEAHPDLEGIIIAESDGILIHDVSRGLIDRFHLIEERGS